MTGHEERSDRDKLGMFVIAGMVVVVLGGIVWGSFGGSGEKADQWEALLGTVATGLILFLRDLIAAVRGSWSEVPQGKAISGLTSGQPNPDPVPHDAAEGARQAADAADEKATKLERNTLD